MLIVDRVCLREWLNMFGKSGLRVLQKLWTTHKVDTVASRRNVKGEKDEDEGEGEGDSECCKRQMQRARPGES